MRSLASRRPNTLMQVLASEIVTPSSTASPLGAIIIPSHTPAEAPPWPDELPVMDKVDEEIIASVATSEPSIIIQ